MTLLITSSGNTNLNHLTDVLFFKFSVHILNPIFSIPNSQFSTFFPPRDKELQARIIRTDLGKGTPLDTVENVAKDFEHGINRFAEDVTQTEAFKNSTAVVGEIGRTTLSGFSAFGSLVGAKFAEVRQSESVNNIAGKASGLGSSLLVSIQVMQSLCFEMVKQSLKLCFF